MPTENGPSLEQFEKYVANHTMQVLLDQGVYRHLKFLGAPPHSWNQWFEIITTPGLLTINGDMGTWTFSRVTDMFNFFRSPDRRINPSYWTEKLQGGRSEATEFDGETFKAALVESLEGYNLTAEQRSVILRELDETHFDDDESCVRRAVDYIGVGDFSFQDTWEISGKRYQYRYIWCLRAIVWAINKYDEESSK